MERTITKRKLRVLLWAVVSMMLLSITSYGQGRSISGVVTGAADQQPIPGVAVKVKGTNIGVSTDVNGRYTISAKSGDVLVFSSIGYRTTEVPVGTSNTVQVSLEEDVTNLNEVVVVGYGTMKKTDLTSSQVTITSAEIGRTVNTTLEQAIQGRAANVYVTAGSGQPGAAPQVLIRGFNSITGGNQPLYVIDGVQIRPDNSAGTMNAIAGINPEDIETMNILQGPSATSIYGATGANGVVLITTKRGRAGQTKVSANTLWTMQDVPDFIPVMNLREYAEYRNAYADAGNAAREPLFADPSVLGDGTNWQDALFRRTLLQKHSLSLSGGTEKTTFYFSGEHFNQEGIVEGSGFKRYSVRLNLDNQTRDWLKIGTNLSVNQTGEIVNISNSDILNLAVSQNPSIPVTNPDGSWGGPTTTQFQYTNPLALASINDNRNRGRAFVGGAYADIRLYKGLVLHNEVNGNLGYNNNYRFNPSYQFGGYVNETTTGSRTANNNYWYNFHTRLQYETLLGKHSINAMVAHESQEWGAEGLSGARNGWITNTNQELVGGNTEGATNSSSRSHGARDSYFGRLNYVFNNRYIAQFTYRADGSSQFGPDRRWGYFPAASVAWRISQENFMKPLTAVNDLKLRFEYGLSGNSGGSGYFAGLQAVPTPWGSGFLAANFPNPVLGWETSKTANVGFDLYMFNSRLEVIADAYVKDIEDLLTINQYPYYTGGDISYSPGYIQFPTSNIGAMRNRGFGVTVNSVNIKKKNLEWRTSFNFSMDRNKVTELYSDNGINTVYEASQLQTSTRVGQPAALITGYIVEGLFQDLADIQNHAIQTPTATHRIDKQTGTWVGDIKFKDLNDDGFINEQDRTVIGNPFPKFTYGFNNALTIGNFDLNLFIIGAQGNDVYNFTRYENERPNGRGVGSNYYKTVSNFARVVEETDGSGNITNAYLANPGTNIPRIAPTSDPNGNNRASQAFVEDGSYLRLKNISLGYSVPKRFLAKAPFLGGLRAAINVQNLFTITKYKGYDPEVGMTPQGGTLVVGVDRGRYPSTRMYSFNLTADF
ncbi:TonB-dependent receptor [Pedobacter sp. SYSU D00535]|uniref:SusC/RagA family TonB-linked outer membrane protein n=1 Tax=Pedobacter sp. SYSU D00535 TaxID=2810308 RepID=UPI001A95F108|nr:TonB-dependent receptor [Pedobacter sp. SYSU D00535]